MIHLDVFFSTMDSRRERGDIYNTRNSIAGFETRKNDERSTNVKNFDV